MTDPDVEAPAEGWRTSDGTPVTSRPIRPEDAAIEQDFVRKLSPESRHNRFLQSIRELSPAMLRRFTEIDFEREMALIATTVESGVEVEIGVARFITNPDGRSCEFALVVADDWQGRGLGSHLMTRLIAIAAGRGLETMTGEVLTSNHTMLGLVRRLEFEVGPSPEEPSLRVVTRSL